MALTKGLKALFKDIAKKLKGSKRRTFMAQVVKLLGEGGQRRAERELNWNRVTIHKGMHELESGFECIDAFAARGRKRAEEHLPNLLKDITAIVDEQSQTDPKFKTTRLYTRISAAEVRKQLILQKGYTEEKVTQERGGLIISLDGLEPEGASEALWVVREVQEDLNLVVGWLPRVNHKTLGALLKPVVDLGLPILATVSDKQGCVRKALEEVLPDVPHQWCQPHYLGNATRPIYDRDSELKTELRKTIRREIRGSMGEVLSDPEGADFSPSDSDGPGGR